jgi:SAM-dependent methyltransferase
MSEAGSDVATEPGAEYDAFYYSHGCGPECHPSHPHWRQFFATIADRLIEIVKPSSVLDAGCALGILVGSLRERGVDAEGVDISQYAIDNADPRTEGRVRVGNLAEPFGRRYDLITCIEVLEHIEAGQVEQVVANLCAAADVLLISTTPDDFNEATHINVRPAGYWTSLFADHGFVRRFDVDASFVSPWALVLEKRTVPQRQLVHEYEAGMWELRRVARGTRQAVLDREHKLGNAHRENEALRARTHEATDRLGELEPLRAAVLTERARAEAAERQLAAALAQARTAQEQYAKLTGSTRVRVANAAASRIGRARKSRVGKLVKRVLR